MMRYGEAKVKAVKQEMNLGGTQLENFMRTSIQRTTTSFRTYRRRGVVHRSSKPGSPPNTDTGLLARSINTMVLASKNKLTLSTGVRSKKRNKFSRIPVVRYAKWLEYGTRGMAKRPFVGPAFRKFEPKILARIKKAMAR